MNATRHTRTNDDEPTGRSNRPKVPTDPVAQVQWLIDQALISDLLVEFARTLDERDLGGQHGPVRA